MYFTPADVNECNGVNDCQQICLNTNASYECSCMNGFTLGDDERNCTGTVIMQTSFDVN